MIPALNRLGRWQDTHEQINSRRANQCSSLDQDKVLWEHRRGDEELPLLEVETSEGLEPGEEGEVAHS